MTQMIEVYSSASSSTSTSTSTSVGDVMHQPPTVTVALFVTGRHTKPYVSEQLAAEIREALAAAERGETEDLGSFAQYADEPDDED